MRNTQYAMRVADTAREQSVGHVPYGLHATDCGLRIAPRVERSEVAS